jgi:hypothetical protein
MDQKLTPSEIPANERAAIFHEQYGNDIDAGATLADIVLAAGDFLSCIVGPEDADAGMARIVEGVTSTSGNRIRNPEDWRTALDESRADCFSEWPIGARLHDLAAYAIYGIVLDGSEDTEERSRRIEELLSDARDLLQATPVSQWRLPPNSDLTRLVRLAENRWALDNGRPVEPAALAEFGGVTEGRIRNMMSGASRTFTPDEGRIPAQEALAWLGGKEAFWTSIWREQSMPEYGVKRRAPVDSPVFVPVSRDGSAFHPGLTRGGGYTIGEKGSEIQATSFEEALAALQRMPTPYWRRPNASGHWGIVAGVRWERLDLRDLEVLAANPGHKLPDNERA